MDVPVRERTSPSSSGPASAPAVSESGLLGRERALLHELAQLVAERAQAEPQIERQFKTGTQAAEEEFETTFQATIIRFAAEKEASEREFQQACRSNAARFEEEAEGAEKEFFAARERIVDEFETARQKAKSEFDESRWTIAALFEGIKNGAETQIKETKTRSTEAQKRLESLREQATDFLQACRQSSTLAAVAAGAANEPEVPANVQRVEHKPEAPAKPFANASGSGADLSDLFKRLDQALSSADVYLHKLKGLKAPQYFRGERLLWIFFALWIAAVLLSGFLAGRAWGATGWLSALIGCTAAVLVLGAGLSVWLRRVAKRQVSRLSEPFARALAEAEELVGRCRDQTRVHARRRLAQGTKRFNRDLRQAKEKHQRRRAEMKEQRAAAWSQVSEQYRRRRTEIKQRRDTDLAQTTERYERLRTEIQDRYERDSRQEQEKHSAQLAICQSAYEAGWSRLVSHWQQGLEQIRATAGEINQECSRWFWSWNDPTWDNWLPGSSFPPAIRFGEYHVSLEHFPGGIPKHPRLRAVAAFSLPALLSFPNHCALEAMAHDEGRAESARLLQTVMFRLITSVPPGKVRFTIIDPVGLGQNFASFMHLADYDEALVTSRIWTERSHIEQRLADLTGHMENVIQKYLRNQFETIKEYNAHAGEVAEPYRILVIANFPVNFTLDAARRLVSILSSGPRCGVYTLLSVDTKQAVPQGFSFSGAAFDGHDGDFEKFPLTLDPPPPAELCNRILHIAGAKARDAKRVEVPFDFVAPPPEQWWTADSRPGISVPLGRVGATGRQHLKLGQGTAQHVLIAGKTGSGKSTLLHALISNLALLYSPQEVELYLVDFKKGVEFKTYATHTLPHARVVAVESEREFGLSVLQRLDAELKLRGDCFREVGAQNLSAYRQANGNRPTPRILLIVDEFQEFFVEDDKIAQDAALLLDRLVRQGRAFGLHVLLGSQTLGGAYTLARSTIDQMAVRIALQCSDADGHIILSDDNSAARLLSRPGEAIYNDANGLIEGNNPFQVVWLDDERRERYLQQIQELSQKRNLASQREQIVFEGNAPSDVAKNPLLRQRLQATSWPETPPAEAYAWLGEAVAIKDPTAALFRPQSGNNLLIIGQNGEAALGILATALVGLAAQYPLAEADKMTGWQADKMKEMPNKQDSKISGQDEQMKEKGSGESSLHTFILSSCQFLVLDGSPEDAPEAGFLAGLSAVVPHPVRAVGWRDLPTVIGDLAGEVERRQQARITDAPAVYGIIFGLQRFRDLRKQEDDFGFSRREEKPSPARQFGTILRDGPGVGIHILVWCDSFNNLNRTFDRQTLREFELRVLFQMSAADSSNLIDSPLASKLGLHRALFHSEEQGRLEKFRPYGLPSESWLQWVRRQFESRCSR